MDGGFGGRFPTKHNSSTEDENLSWPLQHGGIPRPHRAGIWRGLALISTMMHRLRVSLCDESLSPYLFRAPNIKTGPEAGRTLGESCVSGPGSSWEIWETPGYFTIHTSVGTPSVTDPSAK